MYQPGLLGGMKLYNISQEEHTRDIRSPDLAPGSTVFPQFRMNKQGLWIYTRTWPVEKPVGVVFIVHGTMRI